MTLDFDTMNEADVREIIVRPLLHRLGYRHGTEANIRTEVTLRYPKAFLGRKKPKDPGLEGRADYICEVISYGRWVVEVKSPSEPLDQNTIQQAHTYAAHPEVAAAYFLVTNGREFQLHQTGVLDQAALAWQHAQTEEFAVPLFNVVGPQAIRERSKLLKVDAAKPLGRGLSSEVTIIGGRVTYEEHSSTTPLMPNDAIQGLTLPVTGGWIRRAEDGRLYAHVEVAKAAALFQDFKDAIGAADDYDFFSADEYISDDPLSPTIFQSLYENETRPGSLISIPGLGKIPLPFGFTLKAFTEAVGFVEEGFFRGTMRLDYDVTMTGLTPFVRAQMEARLGKIPDRTKFSGLGSFEVRFSNY
jgi:hypothetical protein